MLLTTSALSFLDILECVPVTYFIDYYFIYIHYVVFALQCHFIV